MNGGKRAACGFAIAALAGCSTLLGVDKDYREVSVFGEADGSALSDGASDASSGSDGRIFPVNDGGPLPPPTSIAAGAGSSCAVLAGGGVACWGDNGQGALGDGTTEPRLRPVTTRALGGDALAVAVGGDVAAGAHGCALLGSGAISCWGAATDGTDAGPTLSPVSVAGLPATGIDAGGTPMIAAGAGFTCVSTGGPVYCWGANDSGQLGDGTQDSRATPAPVSNLEGVTALAAGSKHACALTADGVSCWGSNASGQLGLYNTGQGVFATPGKVYGSGDAVAITAGAHHSCMVRRGGKMACWGANNAGQLGNGMTSNRPVPDNVGGKQGGIEPLGTAIVASGDHTCAILTAGGVQCWGANGSGQLGDGTTIDRLQPVAVRSLTATPQSLALGAEHSCALMSDQTVTCWGAGGRLGDGTTNGSPDGVRVAF